MKHRLIANRWRTPDGTLLWSKHTHDFVSHKDKIAEDDYFVDGGNDYIRMSANGIPLINECVYADDDFEKVREFELRGTFATDSDNGNVVRAWIAINRMSDAHLCNCIIDRVDNFDDVDILTSYIDTHTLLYMKELLYRYEKGVSIADHQYLLNEFSHEPVYVEIDTVHHNNFNPFVLENKENAYEHFLKTLDRYSEGFKECATQIEENDIRYITYCALKWMSDFIEEKEKK